MPDHAKQIVVITKRTLTWFWRLDRTLVDCQPGMAVKDTYATIYYVPLGRIPHAQSIARQYWHQNAAVCADLQWQLTHK